MSIENKLVTIAENMQAVYDAGVNAGGGGSEYNKGYSEGYSEGHQVGITEGIEQGKNNEYDRFWDSYQDSGNRTNYEYAFSGSGWNDTTYKPKYPIALNSTQTTYAFYNSQMSEVEVDLQNATALSNTFRNARATKITLKNLSAVCTFSGAFAAANLIEDLILINCVIGENDFNVRWAKALTRESLLNILNSLENKSLDTSGTNWIVTFPTTAETNLTDDDKAIATNKNWTIEYK